MNLEKQYPKKRVLITGAGSGLGRALAMMFAKRTWNVIAADIDIRRANETIQQIEKYGGKSLAIQCDVTNEKHCIDLLTTIQKEYDGIDILINNAGVAAAGFFEKIPIKIWDWIYTINTKSIIIMCRTFIPMFKNQGYGYIINIASNAGIASLPEMACYNMTKAAVISLSETIRSELYPHNINVSVVCPTFFKTNLMDQFTSTDKRQEIIARKFFEHAYASAEDIAEHIIQCISKRKFYIIKQPDGKFIWRFKRLFPELYFKFISFSYRKGLLYKHLKISPDEINNGR